MSKEKPEIGDVWQHKKCKENFLIILYDLTCKDDFEVFNGFNSYALDKKTIKENYNFLGKSKANINELFEVKE